MEVQRMAQVQLHRSLHMSSPREKYRLSSPSITQLIKCKPTGKTKTTDEIAARRKLAQKEWWDIMLNEKRDDQLERELNLGIVSQQESIAKEAAFKQNT